MASPFDFKAVLLAKHAQHVVFIHFPIALFFAGVLFDVLSQWTQARGLVAAAYWNLFAAAVSTLPALVTGILAWQWQLGGQKLKGTLLMHLISGCISSVCILIVWLIHREAQRHPENPLPSYRLSIEAVAVAIVAFTGHLGGFLSGVNGAG